MARGTGGGSNSGNSGSSIAVQKAAAKRAFGSLYSDMPSYEKPLEATKELQRQKRSQRCRQWIDWLGDAVTGGLWSRCRRIKPEELVSPSSAEADKKTD